MDGLHLCVVSVYVSDSFDPPVPGVRPLAPGGAGSSGHPWRVGSLRWAVVSFGGLVFGFSSCLNSVVHTVPPGRFRRNGHALDNAPPPGDGSPTPAARAERYSDLGRDNSICRRSFMVGAGFGS